VPAAKERAGGGGSNGSGAGAKAAADPGSVRNSKASHSAPWEAVQGAIFFFLRSLKMPHVRNRGFSLWYHNDSTLFVHTQQTYLRVAV